MGYWSGDFREAHHHIYTLLSAVGSYPNSHTGTMSASLVSILWLQMQKVCYVELLIAGQNQWFCAEKTSAEDLAPMPRSCPDRAHLVLIRFYSGCLECGSQITNKGIVYYWSGEVVNLDPLELIGMTEA